MGLIAGALLNLDGHLGLRGWQWLFLVEGMPAVLLGIAFFLFSDTPAHAKWLTEASVSRIVRQVNKAPSEAAHQGDSIGATLLDPRVALMLFMLASSYAYTFIAPDIVQRSTHLSTTIVGFIIAGLSLLGASAVLSLLSQRHALRPHSGEVLAHHSPGACLSRSASSWRHLDGPSSQSPLSVSSSSPTTPQGPLWSLPATFLEGRSAAAGIAAINMIGITGGFLGPYFIGFAKDLTGDYQRGLRLMGLPMLLGT